MKNLEKTFNQLIEWQDNPRPVASKEDRAEMKANLQHNGQITPLITRPSGKKSEVIAGRNRLTSIGELIEEGLWPKDKPIMVSERVMDDAEALNIATSENINIPMHPMHQFEAFNRLIEQGRNIVDIANTYGVSRRIVEQRLSYAKLDERARDIVKSGERDLDWASSMTVASLSEQEAILDEMKADPRRYRNSQEVKSRLMDELVPLSYALFDEEKAEADKIRKDLFDEEDQLYMKQSDFIPLQDKALEELVEERKKEGWSKVSVVSERNFDLYRYNDGITDKEKAEVIFIRYANGEVVERQGMALRFEERINDIDENDEEAAENIFGGDDSEDISYDEVSIRADLAEEEEVDTFVESKKTNQLLEKERAAAIQAMLLKDKKLNLATLVAGLIHPTCARVLEGKPYTHLSDLDKESPSRIVIEEKTQNANNLLKEAGIDATLGYSETLDKLYLMEEDELMFILQVEMARKVATELPRIQQMYENTLVTSDTAISEHWKITRTFLETLTSKSIRGLGIKILPPRFNAKLGGSKSDMIETIAQIAEDISQGGSRLTEEEKDVFNSWAPKILGGTNANKIDNSIFAEDHDEGAAIFQDEEAA